MGDLQFSYAAPPAFPPMNFAFFVSLPIRHRSLLLPSRDPVICDFQGRQIDSSSQQILPIDDAG